MSKQTAIDLQQVFFFYQCQQLQHYQRYNIEGNNYSTLLSPSSIGKHFLTLHEKVNFRNIETD